MTALPIAGQVVGEGQVLYEVNGTPVVLLYGSTPAYRSLRKGISGADAAALNADLVALGYATKSQLSPTSDDFGSATEAAVKKLQKHLGVDETGKLTLGQAVFLPTAAKITNVQATLGASIGAGAAVLEATSTTRQVTADLDTSEQLDVKAGDDVTITLPDKQTTTGRVSAVGAVAAPSGGSSGSDSAGSGSSSADQTTTVEADVTLLHPDVATAWDQAPVQVDITTGKADNALVVPVEALQAKAGGGYSVEVVDASGGRHRVPVSLGLFDDADGLVQVTGTNLRPGQHVVVPEK